MIGANHCKLRASSLSEYVSKKIAMLENEFYIRLSDEEIFHMRSLKTEVDVNKYVHQIIVQKL